MEILSGLLSVVVALMAIWIGGGFLSREKYQLFSNFWFRSLQIIHSMKVLTNPAKNKSEFDAFKNFISTREYHQNEASDCFFRLQPLFSDAFVKKSYEFFRLIDKIELMYFMKEQDSKLAQEFYELYNNILSYEAELLKTIRKELKKIRYKFLK